MMLLYHILLVYVLTVVIADDGTKWNKRAQETLEKALEMEKKLNKNVAKNVILFLGDGMGVSTVSAARLYKAQLTNKPEGSNTLTFEDFPYVALSKTYSIDRQTSESAGTGTAFLSGIKANSGTLGVNSNVPRFDCKAVKGNTVQSILDWSEAEGKNTGIVTTARITTATPAATYAHTANKEWENDAAMKDIEGNCTDIARQLIEDNKNIEVILGGGRREFLRVQDGGKREDNRSLIEDWKRSMQEQGVKAAYVDTLNELNKVDVKTTDRILGLFSMSHLDYAIDRNDTNNKNDQPSLAEMTGSAIKMLKKNSNGFFLLVEAGRIDHAHHENQAKRALYDTIAFDEAIRLAVSETNETETLIVVTADHSHILSMAGYPETGNDILGIVKPVAEGNEPLDGLPYLSLIYGNGPGAKRENKSDNSGTQRRNFTNVDTHDNDFRFNAAVELPHATHSAEDVGIYATGPMSHLFHGVHEQNYIAHVMAYASCVGSNKNHCKK